jgi:hypothetical protein
VLVAAPQRRRGTAGFEFVRGWRALDSFCSHAGLALEWGLRVRVSGVPRWMLGLVVIVLSASRAKATNCASLADRASDRQRVRFGCGVAVGCCTFGHCDETCADFEILYCTLGQVSGRVILLCSTHFGSRRGIGIWLGVGVVLARGPGGIGGGILRMRGGRRRRATLRCWLRFA